ncbi:MAG: hypothetical protein ACREP7_17410 [Lysobacter sp.]
MNASFDDLTTLMIVLMVLVPLIAIVGGAFFIIKLQRRAIDKVMKLQRQVIDKVSNTELELRLQRSGVASTAQVLDAADTGGRIEAIYILTRLRLQIAAAQDVEGFVAEIVVPLSPVRVAQMVPGSTVKVRVDPVSREVVLDQPRK